MTDATTASIDAFFDDPYPTYAAWRSRAPLVPVAGALFATSFDAVMEILQDHGRFSSRWPRDGADFENPFRLVLITDDPPRHTRLRGLVNRAFTPRRVAALEPAVRDIVDACIARFPSECEVDFMDELGVAVPVTTIASLLGVPADERDRFRRWSNAVISAQVGNVDRTELAAFSAYLAAQIDRRRAEPVDDLINALATAEIDGERLEDWEVIGFAAIMLVAGNESTAGLLGNLLHVLATRPDLWSRLRDDRTLVEPVIEETLRFDAPVQVLTRWANDDTTVCGVDVPKETTISVGYGAANRDPSVFEDPDDFLVDRPRSPQHVAFGTGIHYCLGAPLARLEANVALNALLDRFSSVRPGAEPGVRQRRSQVVRSFDRLPLRFDEA